MPTDQPLLGLCHKNPRPTLIGVGRFYTEARKITGSHQRTHTTHACTQAHPAQIVR
jgi:hypothetical protein